MIERNRVIILGYPRDGLTFLSHMAGLFGQRLWFYRKTTGYTDKLKVSGSCTGCGLCVSLCPMNNISVREERAVGSNRCTMCYRCISHCPQRAITLLGDRVIVQYRFDMQFESSQKTQSEKGKYTHENIGNHSKDI